MHVRAGGNEFTHSVPAAAQPLAPLSISCTALSSPFRRSCAFAVKKGRHLRLALTASDRRFLPPRLGPRLHVTILLCVPGILNSIDGMRGTTQQN